MPKYITEDDIEQAILCKPQLPEFVYNIIRGNPSPDKREELPDGTGRTSKKECVLPCVLKEALVRINSHINEEIIDDLVKRLSRDYIGTDIVATNYELYNQIETL